MEPEVCELNNKQKRAAFRKAERDRKRKQRLAAQDFQEMTAAQKHQKKHWSHPEGTKFRATDGKCYELTKRGMRRIQAPKRTEAA